MTRLEREQILLLSILDEMMTEGLVTMEKVRVVRYGGVESRK